MRIDDGPAGGPPPQATNDQLVRAAEAAGFGLYTFDAGSGSLRWSPRLVAMLGLAPGTEASAQVLRDLVEPEDRHAFSEHIARVVRQAPGDRHTHEFRLRRPDGERRWLRDNSELYLDDHRHRLVVGTVEDVTGWRRAIEDLREREARFGAVFRSIDEGFCLCEMVVDDDGRPVDYLFLEVNARFEEMTGLADATGRRARDLVPGLEDHWVETYARVGLGGETLRFQNGSEAMGRWFDVFATPVEPHGRFALVFTDVTARRRAEAELRESEARFRNMADNAPVMIWMTDPDGTCTYLNAGWYRFTGQSEEEALGFGWLEATHPDDRDETERLFVESNQRRAPFRFEYRLRRHDGAYRWALDSATPRLSPDGGFLGYIGSVIDIEDRRQVEEALRRREARERQARWRLELLATIISELQVIPGVRARAQRLVELLVPTLADLASIVVAGATGPALAAASVEPGRVETLRALALDGDALTAAEVSRPSTRDYRLIRDVSPAVRTELAADPAWARLLDQFDPTSLLVLPLQAAGDGNATLVLAVTDPDRPAYAADDAAFVRQIADKATLLLADAYHQQQEQRISLRLQRALLPDRLAVHPSVSLSARYQAAGSLLEVGGDWYDTFLLPDGRLGLAVGDVVGHGLDAAAVMGRLRAALTALAPRGDGPGEILAELDRFARGPSGTRFATACCAVLDPDTRTLSYASAGHPPGLVCTPSGRTSWLDGGRSVPLSVGPPQARRAEAATVVEPGSLVVLYSDGLVERRHEDPDHGVSRLEAAVRALATAPVDEICDRLLAGLAGPDGFDDDVVVLALRT